MDNNFLPFISCSMSCGTSVNTKRTRYEDFNPIEDGDNCESPLKKCSKHFQKWSLSIATPQSSPVKTFALKRKSKSLDEELIIGSPVKFGCDTNVLNAEFQGLTLENSLSVSEASSNRANLTSPVFCIPELLHRIFKLLNPESLYNCSKVNPLWAAVASRIINQDLVIQPHSISGDLRIVEQDNMVHPQSLTFYKLKQQKLFIDTQFPHINFSRLNSLNFYISPVIPMVFDKLVVPNNVTKLTIAGDKRISDIELITLIKGLPNLIELDLRACSQISDVSIVSIVTHCPKLQSINLGRHDNPHLITDLTVMALCELENLTTVGLSGCTNISDVSIWQLYNKHSTTLVRLSINGCKQITDNSIVDIVTKNGFPNLSVLDIRNCSLIRFKRLIEYRLWRYEVAEKPIHIHISDSMQQEFELQERQLYKEFRARIRNDLNKWVNE